MGRPSLKKERSNQILDAFGVCIARFGLEGATLEKTAEEAGVKRSIIRHYLGNRDQMLEAFVTRFMSRYEEQSRLLFVSLPAERKVETLLSWLFEGPQADAEEVLIFEALVMAASRHDYIRVALAEWVENFVDGLATIIETEKSLKQEDAWMVAQAMVSLYFNQDALAPLGLPKKYRAESKRAALTLLEAVENA